MLDSAYRQNIIPYESPVAASTDYSLDLSDTLTNTLSIKLSSVQIPYTWYNIAGYLGNSCFGYIIDPSVTTDFGYTHIFSIPNNQYPNAQSVLNALNNDSAYSGLNPNLVFSLTGASDQELEIILQLKIQALLKYGSFFIMGIIQT